MNFQGQIVRLEGMHLFDLNEYIILACRNAFAELGGMHLFGLEECICRAWRIAFFGFVKCICFFLA